MITPQFVVVALLDELEVALDQASSATQHEGDLADFEALASELRATPKRSQIVGDGFGRVARDLANLGRGLAFEREPDNLHSMAQHGADIVHGAAPGQRTRIVLAQPGEVARDGSQPDQEDAPGEVLAGEQCAL